MKGCFEIPQIRLLKTLCLYNQVSNENFKSILVNFSWRKLQGRILDIASYKAKIGQIFLRSLFGEDANLKISNLSLNRQITSYCIL